MRIPSIGHLVVRVPSVGHLVVRVPGLGNLVVLIVLLGLALLGSGCGDPTAADRIVFHDLGDAAVFRTDGVEHQLHTTKGGRGLLAWVPYTVTNAAPDTLFLYGCGRRAPWRLDRFDGFEWRTVKAPIVLGCGPSAVRIPPGAQWSDSIRISGYFPRVELPGSLWPGYEDGIYRIVWHDGVSRIFDQDGPPFGELVEARYRTSNVFRLRLADRRARD